MFTTRGFLVAVMCAAIALGGGCAKRNAAPIAQKPQPPRSQATVHRHGSARLPSNAAIPASHTVRKGDTLHSIAWRYRLDYRKLARWNRLANPNLIYAGQKLRLSAPRSTRPKTAQPKSASKPAARATAKPKTKSRQPARASAPVRLSWTWPARGTVRPAVSALGTKGIEILGKRGQSVKAAAGGEVVYSGSGLRGYGRLIIVKHNEEFLSAYAHNERLLVAEGATVKSGESIAQMGDSEAKTVMLHFEIRRDGKAVEPLKLLPRR